MYYYFFVLLNVVESINRSKCFFWWLLLSFGKEAGGDSAVLRRAIRFFACCFIVHRFSDIQPSNGQNNGVQRGSCESCLTQDKQLTAGRTFSFNNASSYYLTYYRYDFRNHECVLRLLVVETNQYRACVSPKRKAHCGCDVCRNDIPLLSSMMVGASHNL